MSGPTVTAVTLPAEAATVGRARTAVREALGMADAALLETTELAVSEIVTNAVVHAGTEIQMRITAETGAVYVEVEDGSPHCPTLRNWSETAGTGRGLRIVNDCVDKWDVNLTATGKIVWFEIGRPTARSPVQPPHRSTQRPAAVDAVDVTLLNVPVLMHWAWQEHAATLLREYLLYALHDDAHALDDHAAASDALSVLDEQMPAPHLPSDPGALMASSIEPTVTSDRVALRVPVASISHFEVLDKLLSRAVGVAHSGHLMSPPTQPEIGEMRTWICGEVAAQANDAVPVPWRAHIDVRAPLDPTVARDDAYRDLAGSDEPLIATNERSLIVAVTPPVIEFLGYRDEAELLGRRILVLVPPRYHQAHIAGTTMHMTNGRDALLEQWLTVPVVRADATEVMVEMRVDPRRLDADRRVFVASFRLPSRTP